MTIAPRPFYLLQYKLYNLHTNCHKSHAGGDAEGDVGDGVGRMEVEQVDSFQGKGGKSGESAHDAKKKKKFQEH